MSFLKKLFGVGGAPSEPKLSFEDYKGFRIAADPAGVDGQYRIGAWIEKDVDGEVKKHHLIRADLLRDKDEADLASLAKAKVMIDQMGDMLFRSHSPD